jgi:drug/metabolite transporter (DMT)-like permease
VCFFGLFYIFYNIALGYTTPARASLALSTLPLQTMAVGAVLGIEPLTVRKTLGVAIAMFGVFAGLAKGLGAAPCGAWRGEAIMAGAVLCMAFYNVWSHRLIVRSSALGFLCVGMGAGAAALIVDPMGEGAATHNAHACRQYNDGQSNRRGPAGEAIGRRADHIKSGGRFDRGFCGDLDRHDRR